MITPSFHFNNSKVTNKQSIRFLFCLNVFATALQMVVGITPLISRLVQIRFKLAFFALWLMSTLLLFKKKPKGIPHKLIAWWSVYVVMLFGMCILGHSNVSIIFFLSQLQFYAIPFMMIVVMGYYNERERRLLWYIIIAIFLSNLASNYILGFRDPELFYMLSRMGDDEGWYTNAGGTSFVAMCLFLCSVFWIIYRESSFSLSKVISFICVIAFAYYILFLNSRATALIIFIFYIATFIFIEFNKKKKKTIKSIFIYSAIVIGILVYFSTPLLEFLLSLLSDSDRMTARLAALIDLSSGTSVNNMEEGSFTQRYELWMTSINTFFSDFRIFIFGVGEDEHQNDINGLIRYGVGYHSEFFDLAAKYGIIGIVLIYNFLRHLFEYINKFAKSEKGNTMLNVFLLGFILYSFFNGSFTEPTFYVLMVFLPLSLNLMYNKQI